MYDLLSRFLRERCGAKLQPFVADAVFATLASEQTKIDEVIQRCGSWLLVPISNKKEGGCLGATDGTPGTA